MLYALCSMLCICGFAAHAGPVIQRQAGGNLAAATGDRGARAEAYRHAVAMQTPVVETATVVTTGGDAEAAVDTSNLPVRVANIELARDIASGRGRFNVQMAQLENCSMIFPRGRFAWDSPTAGARFSAGQVPGVTCVAEVELRQVHGNNDVILARARVAAGDTIHCNIGAFPTESYTPEAFSLTFPRDSEPTLGEVRRQMDREFRGRRTENMLLAAAAGGVTGYFTTGGWVGAGIGAVAGAGVGHVATDAGHITGNVIMGATVNAVSSAVIANIMDERTVLWVDDCPPPATGMESISGQCLFGQHADTNDLPAGQTVFYNIRNRHTIVCDENLANCNPTNLMNVRVHGQDLSVIPITRTGQGDGQYCFHNAGMITECEDRQDRPVEWNQVEPTDGIRVTLDAQPAVCIGWTNSNPARWDREGAKSCPGGIRSFVGGRAGPAITNASAENFVPRRVSTDDRGQLVDMSNLGWWSPTHTGAMMGGALGGWAAFQGADEELTQRWLAEMNAYRGSLNRIYCGTGTQLLSTYNDIAIIPNTR